MGSELPELSDIDARGLLREIGNEFQKHNWQDTSDFALRITQKAQAMRTLDPVAATSLVDQGFLVRNQTSVAVVQAAIVAVFRGRSLLDPDLDQPAISSTAQNTNITIGDNNAGVQINVGGQQLTLSSTTPRDQVLTGVEAFLREALDGSLAEPRLNELDHLVSSRDDIDQSALERVASQAIRAPNAKSSKVANLRDAVLTSAASGLLVQAILAVVQAI
jgi:hypothetical protein